MTRPDRATSAAKFRSKADSRPARKSSIPAHAPAGPRKVNLDYARRVIEAEARAVFELKKCINAEFKKAAECILALDGKNGGRVVGTGLGKAGIVAQKVCASLASTGTRSLFMHPTEALHGDLGMVAPQDVLLVFSNSGESEEIIKLLPAAKKNGAFVMAMTASRKSSLGRGADLVLELGRIEEPCPLRLAPTASTTAMLALGDALALCVLKARNFTETDYARLHPGGALGRKLLVVTEIMRTDDRLPLVGQQATVGEAVNILARARGGTAVVVNKQGILQGVFSDGDFRRLMIQNPTRFNDPVRQHMTTPCKSIPSSMLVQAAQETMSKLSVNALPIVDGKKRVLGILDIQDLVAW